MRPGETHSTAKGETGDYVNPVTLAVMANLFSSVAEEMGTALQRAALSPNIKERRDFSCVICDSHGDLVAQAAHIPVHLGSAPLSVKAALAETSMAAGDVVILNDPYRGGTHLPDLTMIAPVFLEDQDSGPSFYVANRAHHADIGGMTAGSMPVSEEIFQEGLIIPPLKLVEQGRMNQTVLKLFQANVRTPWEREGDLQAQWGSLRIGIRRLLDITGRYSAEELLGYARALGDYSEKMMRAVLSEIPDGEYTVRDCLDDDGFSGDPLDIAVTIHIRGDRARFDFSASADQVRGNLNAVPAIAVSAVLYVLRLILPQDIPANSGALRPVDIVTREGSILAPRPPAAVAAGNVETSQRIVDVLLAALAKALPDRIPAASQGTMNNLLIGAASDRSFAYYETIGGGAGAGPDGPGASAIHCHMTNTMNTPIEALEAAYPLMVTKYRIRKNSGGAGRFRGGDGIVRDIRLLTPATVTIISERRKHPPYGLMGGRPGKRGKNTLIRKDGSTEDLGSKATFRAEAGDTVSIETPGGGGWGEST